jgi:hypothetical protein
MPDQAGMSNPMVKSAVIGTILQLVMVVVGHFVPQVASAFPIAGTGIGGLAGLLNGLWSKGASMGAAAGGGAVAGGAGGLIGTLVSSLMGDVPMSTLVVGTGSTAVAGVVGGLIGKVLGGRSAS